MIKYEDSDFYEIRTEKTGERNIHVLGYIYKRDCDDDDDDQEYAIAEFSFLIIPLRKFVSKEFYEPIEDFAQEFDLYPKTYIETITAAEAEYYSDHYFSDGSATELRFTDVSMDTPDGYYVHYGK